MPPLHIVNVKENPLVHYGKSAVTLYTLIINALRNTKWNCKGQVVSHRPPFCSEVLENGNPSGEYCYP